MNTIEVNNKAEIFSTEIREEIDRWVAKYPADWKQSAVMAALRIIQDANGGWLTTELMNDVAAYLDMAPIAVYEVATFYSMYELKPVGKHKICICTNVSCMINNSDRVVDHLEDRLGIKLGQTTEDGRFTLKEVECLGACGGAPMMQIGKQYYENLTPEIIDSILEGLE
ncbi:MAG: NADH dehydrogenase [Gammaproteobacteria bacterium (ex Lamellibrachia satsuma)]|nr:MAG: NADH-quinone oxidoreductase subunit NuoE [Gammaproteobacteria bacterium (ex Lamellibrachia satsuma)]RRS32569.1 MAG: NADH dehydrogenase [Gammaproteobacteria bacterium (ex Lamellibrachia satsuma)]RRS37271.1 MAG: NADH dehydrogenase [Gammaproteobacteria bacterium (ex Lamellibrachia satsuma)]